MRFQRCFVALTFLVATADSGHADIFRWDNGQLIPGTEGVTPGPGVQLDHRELEYADLSNADLTGAVLQHANLTDAVFSSSTLINADLSFADTRRAQGLDLTGAISHDTILPDGAINGLDLYMLYYNGLVVRNYTIPITVQDHLTMANGGQLNMLVDAHAWNSTISFQPGIPVSLGGTLDLLFAPDVDVASQVGRKFDLFDWSGVNPTGQFQVASPYLWDLTNLYTSGEVTLLPDVDFNGDGAVDGADLVAWQSNFGLPSGALNVQGDADYDFDVDGGDFLAWQRRLGHTPAGAATGAVPEPSSWVLLMFAAVGGTLARRRRSA